MKKEYEKDIETLKGLNNKLAVCKILPEDEKVSLQRAIDLMKRYDEVAGVLPVKKKRSGWLYDSEIGIYNDTIESCTLAIMKNMEGLEEVIERESEKARPINQLLRKCPYPSSGVEQYTRWHNQLNDLAQAIRQVILNREGE